MIIPTAAQNRADCETAGINPDYYCGPPLWVLCYFQTHSTMKNIRLISVLALAIVAGCQLPNGATPATVTAQIFTPANIAQGTTDIVQAAATAVLAKNPSYLGEVQAVDDALTAMITTNPFVVTTADLQAVLAKTSLTPASQGQWAAILGGALGIFERNFATNLPTLKPNYLLYVKAVANGLNGALGKPPVA